MASEKTDAIILRLVRFSESSAVVTMFTREHGKIAALARGAYRPKSAFEGALDLGSHCSVVFISKSSDALDLLTEAKLQRRFRSAQRSLLRLNLGYFVLELVRELTEDGQPVSGLFELVQGTLTALDSPQIQDTMMPDLMATFILQTLKQLGHSPALDVCAACGQCAGEPARVAFGLQAGGVVCSRCRSRERQLVIMTAQDLAAMKERLNTDLPKQFENYETQYTTPVGAPLHRVLSRIVAYHVGRTLRTQTLIDWLGDEQQAIPAAT